MNEDNLAMDHLSEDGFKKNAPLQLVLGIASLYIIFQIFVLVLSILSDAPKSIYYTQIVPATGIFDWDTWVQQPYTLLTYTFCNKEFLVLFANCFWLYVSACSIAQRYHYKEVIPSYIFISIFSALLYIIILKITGIQPTAYNTGGFSCLIAMSTTMLGGKHHRFKINKSLQVPYSIIFFIILLFTLIQYDITAPHVWILILSSYLTGFLYFQIVKKWPIGRQLYRLVEKVSKSLTPQFKEEDILGWDIDALFQQIKAKHPMIEEEKLNNLFDKIKAEGFKGLTELEKKIFFRLMHD